MTGEYFTAFKKVANNMELEPLVDLSDFQDENPKELSAGSCVGIVSISRFIKSG